MIGVLDDHIICKIRADGSERTCLNEDGTWSLN
jgi:hypothetical protein